MGVGIGLTSDGSDNRKIYRLLNVYTIMYINNMTAKSLWHLCRLQLLKYRKGLNKRIPVVSITASSVIEHMIIEHNMIIL